MDTFDLIAAERVRLADGLMNLGDDDWEQASLCGAWSNAEVIAHLNVPFEVNVLTFGVAFAKALGNFDRANARLASDLAHRMDPAACVENLRANADHRFTPPGFGPEAPLTDVIVHGVDILHPLGQSLDISPEAVEVSFAFLSTGKAARAFGAVAFGDLCLQPDGTDLVIGEGPDVVTGPAAEMLGVLAGRTACLDVLAGLGADVLRQRTA
jgi:uncharacterized protein (TIGR03083 family)